MHLIIMIKPVLTSKIVNAPCKGVKFKDITVPPESVTYNRVQGKGPKGEYDIHSFFDENGTILKMVSRYVNALNGEVIKVRRWAEETCDYFDTVIRNGKVTEYVNNIVLESDSPEKFFMLKETLFRGGDGVRNIHKLSLFAPKQKPRQILYETKYDGRAPKVIYKNTLGTLPDEGLEYLPLFVSGGSNSRIKHVAKAQEIKYGLEGVLPEFQMLPFEDLNPELVGVKGVILDNSIITSGVTNSDTCQISFVDGLTQAEDIITTVTHEYAHADDFTHVYRLRHMAAPVLDGNILKNKECREFKNKDPEAFDLYRKALRTVKKSLAKGLVTKQNTDSAEYWRYKRLSKYVLNDELYVRETDASEEAYRNHFAEIRPTNVANREHAKYVSLVDRIYEILGISNT